MIEYPDKDVINMKMIESKYYNIKQTGALFQKTSAKGFSIFSCNIRSLPKNSCLLNDILLTVKESHSLITISETRLSDDDVNNISIPGYEFISKASKTNAGGVAMYIKDTLKFIKRPDLEITLDGVETCFIELPRVKLNNVIVACIYRHPHSDRKDFNVNLREKLKYLNRQGYEVYIAGDINQDFFQYSTGKQTSDYLDMLLNLGYMPIITKATRFTDHSATLIDHIYTNAPQKVFTSISVSPIFLIICLASVLLLLNFRCTYMKNIIGISRTSIKNYCSRPRKKLNFTA